MATEAQMQEILEVMKQQMAQMTLLHTENTRLREAADAAARTAAPSTPAPTTNASDGTVTSTPYRSMLLLTTESGLCLRTPGCGTKL